MRGGWQVGAGRYPLKKGTQNALDPALGPCDEVRKITGIEIA